jgi:hypothetical protein
MFLLHMGYQEALEKRLSDVRGHHHLQQVGLVFGTGNLSEYHPAP